MAKVTAEDRKKHAVLSDGRFPISDKETAESAIRLRGHTKNKAERRKVLRAAMKYSPQMAKDAWDEDKKKGLI